MKNKFQSIIFLFYIILYLNYTCTAYLISTNTKNFRKKNSTLYCLIENAKYTNEFLYSSFESNNYLDEDDDTSFKRKVFTNQISNKYSSHGNQFIWVLNRVGWLNDTYYITNFFFKQEHLCASHSHMDSFQHRRRVMLNMLNRESLMTNKKCMWVIKSISSTDPNLVGIWNNYYREAFYAASDLFRSSVWNRRNVYLWYDKPDSKQFAWKLKC